MDLFFSRAPLSIKSNPKQDTTQSSIDAKPASAPQVGLWFNLKAVLWKQTMELPKRQCIPDERSVNGFAPGPIVSVKKCSWGLGIL
jgi:hypothetical protein